MIIIPKRQFGLRFFHEVLQQGLEYIVDRQQGRVSSLLLPWNGFNEAGINGIEWGSLVTLASRPGAGKTMTAMQIRREAKQLNPRIHFNILEFQFDMGVNQYAAREFTAHTALDYNQVLSTKKAIDNFSVEMMRRYEADARALHDVGVFSGMITDSLTGDDICEAIELFYNEMKQKPLLIMIDHSWLVKKDRTEKDKTATLYSTVEKLVELKNRLPIIIFMISQLLRTIEDPSRRNPGSIGNYPVSADIFGGDALMQGSDMIAILSKPHTLNIQLYGPRSYIVKRDQVYMHLVKVRNNTSEDDILFMRAEFDRGRLIEIPEPDRQQGAGSPGQYRSPQFGGKQLPVSADIGDN